MNKRLALTIALFFGLGLVLSSCATTAPMPTAANFQAPTIKLAQFEVPQYDEFWYYAGTVEATKGKKGDRGAPLPMSFLFNITNPNPFPILLDSITYTVVFDNEFEVITSNVNDSYWIPAGKTDQVRITTLITVRSALTGLLLANAPALNKKGWNAWDTLERWWKEVPDLAVPVGVKNCSFTFRADGVSKILPFEATAK
jgi:hypothetical protein